MWNLRRWQLIVLAMPPVILMGGLALLAGIQLHTWGWSWVWAVVAITIVLWRWLFSRWTQPDQLTLEDNLETVRSQLQATLSETATSVPPAQVEAVLRQTLETAREDLPLWEDWPAFTQRCQTLIRDIAKLYHPAEKYPLLNIYVPQAYGLIRGTVDDLDRYMSVAAPALNQVTVAQVYQAYETYRRLETPLKRLGTVLDLSRWLWNPIGAVAREVGRPLGTQANQQLLANLSQTLRETALTLLCKRAIALYGGDSVLAFQPPAQDAGHSQTLRELMEAAEAEQVIATTPLNLLLVGRTGAGKSSLINTLFQQDRAAVDVLPSTDQITRYQWTTSADEIFNLWDTPGYEQVDRVDLRQQVLDQALEADVILLANPALDPALDADVAFLRDLANQGKAIPSLVVLTQVDRLRPMREWEPPYNWQDGDRPKEENIRAAVAYRQEQLGSWVQQVLPVVTQSAAENREAWGSDALATQLIAAIAPAKSQRLAQFLRSREARIAAAIRLVERYALQMTSSQGVVALVKTPLFTFLSARFTGTPELGLLLAQSIPAEQVPVVASKMMLTYELASLLNEPGTRFRSGEILKLWPIMLQGSDRPPAHNAWAWGQALVGYWSQDLTTDDLKIRFDDYLDQSDTMPTPIRHTTSPEPSTAADR
ncbi:MAG: GTPase [Leptolyngbya sp. SIOISBB]|nr:GTPase [Leptolyngbya sp. SIOISBB]